MGKKLFGLMCCVAPSADNDTLQRPGSSREKAKSRSSQPPEKPLRTFEERNIVLPPGEQEFRQRLRKHFDALIQLIEPRTGLLGLLLIKGVITPREMDSIKSQPDYREMTAELLILIMKQKTYSDFIELLNSLDDTEQTHIVDVIKSGDVSTPSSPIPSESKSDLATLLEAHGLPVTKFSALFGGVSIYNKADLERHLGDRRTYETVAKSATAAEATILRQMFKVAEALAKPVAANLLPVDRASILRILGIEEYHQNKLSWSEAVTIRDDADQYRLGLIVISKLIMLDYRARLLQQSSSEDAGENNKDQKNLSGFFGSANKRSAKPAMHPLDMLVAIFSCCDGLLRQLLVEKMYMCRLSVPLVLRQTDEGAQTVMLWSLRSVVPDWRGDDAVQQSQFLLVKIPQATISFVRVGTRLNRSKSKLINKLLSDTHHDTFFHRDCEHGDAKRVLSEGLIEASWFMPSARENDRFSQMLTFVNLRGDAKHNLPQSELLCKTSSLVFLMMSVESFEKEDYKPVLEKCAGAACSVLLVLVASQQIPDDSRTQKGVEKFLTLCKHHGISDARGIRDWNDNRMLNETDWQQEACVAINGFLKDCKVKSTLEEFAAKARTVGFELDEDAPACSETRSLAHEITTELDAISITDCKKELLPIQGKPWREFGNLLKKLHRKEGIGNSLPEEFASSITLQMLTRRRNQLTLYSNRPDFTDNFLGKLLLMPKLNAPYFLRWLKLYMDNRSRQTLPGLQAQYHDGWMHVRQVAHNQEEKRSTIGRLNEDLHRLELNICDASFGLEHVFRETGQIFELCSAISNAGEFVPAQLQQRAEMLPEVVARLLLQGCPLELMDGDVAVVPVTWLQAVFAKLTEMIGDKRLFVVSVVGIQSSGKSTLLNTMFGLQFAVSAGRCTRGVFCQLVPVDKTSTGLTCDYILVVDTEGLRAPELGNRNAIHDNELATFVVGLGDVTLVNIKGENVADLNDVLQIVVHAILRMKLANRNMNLNPRCMFIHQNVSDVNAETKLRFMQDKLQEVLDKMTEAAAENEEVRGIRLFKQVIDFDECKDICYVSDLWQGDPPMAPVNFGFSEKVGLVKKRLISEIASKKERFISISDFTQRITDLWNAVLSENFVFSFKNSLEVKAYNSLEAVYSRVAWDLKNEVLQWENASTNAILSCESNVAELKDAQLAKLSDVLTLQTKTARQELENFFATSEYKDVIEQWKSKMDISVGDLEWQLYERVKQTVHNLVAVREAQLQNKQKTEAYQEDILRIASEKAVTLQGQHLEDDVIEKEFDNIWTTWISTLETGTRRMDRRDVELAVFRELRTAFLAHDKLLQEELERNPLSSSLPENVASAFPDISSEDINMKTSGWLSAKEAASFNECKTQAHKECWEKFLEIREYMYDIRGQDFNPNQAAFVVRTISTFFDVFNGKDAQQAFTFTPVFRIAFTTFACRFAVGEFTRQMTDFWRKIDPLSMLEDSYKPQLSTLFRDIYHKRAQEEMAADLFSKLMVDLAKQAVLRDMGRMIADYIIAHEPAFTTKASFVTTVLKELGERRSFADYVSYIRTGEVFLNRKVQEYTLRALSNKGMISETRFAEIACNKLQVHVDVILEAMTRTTESVGNSAGFHDYLDAFQQNLTGSVLVQRNDFQLIRRQNIADLARFEESARARVATITKLTKDSFSDGSLDDKLAAIVQVGGSDPYRLLSDAVLGCCERCPFCKALCCLTIKGHAAEHRAFQHYPQGLAGCHWHNTEQLTVDTCPILVNSDKKFRSARTSQKWHLYRQYKEVYPNWEISPDNTVEASAYWKWVFKTFINEFAAYYKAQSPEIPGAWAPIVWDQAKKSLDKHT